MELKLLSHPWADCGLRPAEPIRVMKTNRLADTRGASVIPRQFETHKMFNFNTRGVLTLILAADLALASSLSGATAILHPVADTTLQSAFPGNNFGDGTTFQAGGRRQGGVARGLFRFDLSGSVPSGATINSVTLTLNVVSTPGGGANSVFDLHNVLQSWGEGNNTDHG